MPETILSNRILSSLTSDEYSHLAPRLQHVSLGLRQMLRGPSVKMDNAYFFTSGMASHVVTMRDGSSMETGVVGRRSNVGLATSSRLRHHTRLVFLHADCRERIPNRWN